MDSDTPGDSVRDRSERFPSSGPRRKTTILRTLRGKVAGKVTVRAGRLVLVKKADPVRHQLRTPLAWAWDASVLSQAERLGATLAIVEEKRGPRTWTAPLVAFYAHGLRVNRGHGEQLALPLERWTVGDRKVVQTDLFTETA
jgi:hypothetical protein